MATAIEKAIEKLEHLKKLSEDAKTSKGKEHAAQRRLAYQLAIMYLNDVCLPIEKQDLQKAFEAGKEYGFNLDCGGSLGFTDDELFEKIFYNELKGE